jgi:hypothetical protein
LYAPLDPNSRPELFSTQNRLLLLIFLRFERLVSNGVEEKFIMKEVSLWDVQQEGFDKYFRRSLHKRGLSKRLCPSDSLRAIARSFMWVIKNPWGGIKKNELFQGWVC